MSVGDVPDTEPTPFSLADRTWSPEEIIRHLDPFVTERRRERIREVVDERTRTVVPVVEGLYNMGNVSAVLRSAEALGYQSLHVIEGEKRFANEARTAAGTRQWLDVERWPEADACYDALRDRGYRLLVADVEDARPLEEVDFTRRTAVVFGNEAEGVSERTKERADVPIRIPMVGFVESYNISVAAAITLYRAYRDRLERQGRHGDLNEAERERLVARYYLNTVRRPEAILRRIAGEAGPESTGEQAGGSGTTGAAEATGTNEVTDAGETTGTDDESGASGPA